MDASGESVATATAQYTELHRCLQEALRGYVCGLLPEDSAQASDIVQEVFVAAFLALGKKEPWIDNGDAKEMRKWLFTVAHHKAMSYLRRKRIVRIQSLEQLAEQGRLNPSEPASIEEQVTDRILVRAALARVPAKYRACLLLNSAHGYTAEEVGQIVGIQRENAKKRIARGKERLRAELEALGLKPNGEVQA
jgi:RNA polymerase sigma-70 factor (ECF subfamily)